jgi:aspartate racemase
VFGCTELGLLLQPDQLDVPVYDTARVHAQAAVDYAT